jgi:hypothetical protein
MHYQIILLFEILRFILGPNVLPASVEALNTSQSPDLLDHHIEYTFLSPEVDIGVFALANPRSLINAFAF